MIRSIRSISLILFLFFLYPPGAHSAEQGEGYDKNTELTVTGTIKEVVKESRGPVIIRLLHRDRIYNVYTAPPWYLRQENIVFTPGLEIEVTGSKVLAEDGAFYLLSWKIREVKTGRVIIVRDDLLKPLWKGRRQSR